MTSPDLGGVARRAAARDEAARRDVVALQRLAGNRAVAGLVAHEGAAAITTPDATSSAVTDVVRSPGTPLAPELRAEMEGRLGADFRDVRLHSDDAARRSAAALGAQAYTAGHHIATARSGIDKHVLAHELTHVLQQRRGPVDGTDHGGAMSVSDPADRFEQAAEANARRVMTAPVRRSPGPGLRRAPSTEPAVAAPARPVQRFGEYFADPSAPLDTPDALADHIDELELLMRRYNVEQDAYRGGRRPDLDLRDAREMVATLAAVDRVARTDEEARAWCSSHDGWLDGVRDAVDREMRHAADQWADYGYFLMYQFGEIWRKPEMQTATFGGSYSGYFRDMSRATLQALHDDPAVARPAPSPRRAAGGRDGGSSSAPPWNRVMRKKVQASLRRCVLRHYLPADRAESILRAGAVPDDERGAALKSKQILLNEHADDPSPADPEGPANNSDPFFDDQVLANTGFVFFYVELPDEPFRASRFGVDGNGVDDPARITVPIKQLANHQGWLMLNDFIDRENPTVRRDDRNQTVAYPRDPDPAVGLKEPVDHYDASGRPRYRNESVPAKSPEGRLRTAVVGIDRLLASARPRADDVVELGRRMRALVENPPGRDADGAGRQKWGAQVARLHEELGREQEHLDAQRVELDRLSADRDRARRDVARLTHRVRKHVPPEGLALLGQGGNPDLDGSTRYYSGPDPHGAVDEVEEPIAHNILVGADVVPGLAQRIVVEVGRIRRSDPDLARAYQAMSGDDLIREFLRKYIRPQAMLPRTVPFRRSDVEFTRR